MSRSSKNLALVLTAPTFLIAASLMTQRLIADDNENQSAPAAPLTLDLLPDLRPDEMDFRLQLASGRTIEIGKTFAEHQAAMRQELERALRSRKPALLRINYGGSDQPLLLASRRGSKLDGPFASFSEEGSPVALVGYKKGERDAALLTWDESGRPIVFAQYQSGQLHGLRCIFKACCDECKTGHVWMVQEWDGGQLQTVHLVGADGATTTHEYRYGDPPADSGIATAVSELASFESRFDGDETKLKQMLAQYHIQDRRAAAMRSRLIASQQRYRMLAAAYQAATETYRHLPGTQLTARRI